MLNTNKYKFLLEQTTDNCTAWTWTNDENMDFQVNSILLDFLIRLFTFQNGCTIYAAVGTVQDFANSVRCIL